MRAPLRRYCIAASVLTLVVFHALHEGVAQDAAAMRLPANVEAVWDLERAQREATETRERICINGLWQWQPAEAGAERVPDGRWGYFKVPGCWPGITDSDRT